MKHLLLVIFCMGCNSTTRYYDYQTTDDKTQTNGATYLRDFMLLLIEKNCILFSM